MLRAYEIGDGIKIERELGYQVESEVIRYYLKVPNEAPRTLIVINGYDLRFTCYISELYIPGKSTKELSEIIKSFDGYDVIHNAGYSRYDYGCDYIKADKSVSKEDKIRLINMIAEYCFFPDLKIMLLYDVGFTEEANKLYAKKLEEEAKKKAERKIRKEELAEGQRLGDAWCQFPDNTLANMNEAKGFVVAEELVIEELLEAIKIYNDVPRNSQYYHEAQTQLFHIFMDLLNILNGQEEQKKEFLAALNISANETQSVIKDCKENLLKISINLKDISLARCVFQDLTGEYLDFSIDTAGVLFFAHKIRALQEQVAKLVNLNYQPLTKNDIQKLEEKFNKLEKPFTTTNRIKRTEIFNKLSNIMIDYQGSESCKRYLPDNINKDFEFIDYSGDMFLNFAKEIKRLKNHIHSLKQEQQMRPLKNISMFANNNQDKVMDASVRKKCVKI